VAYYHQWTAYMNTLTPGIEQSARAFAETGDRRYAHKAAVALFRYAESMLDLSMNMNHRKMAVRDAILRWPVGAPSPRSGLAGTFLYIQPNWDTPRMEKLAGAWDLIFDALDDDRELLAFCRRQYHPEVETADDFRRFVEAGVIRVPLQACLDNAVARNYPMQEVTVATMALAMDSPRSLDLADWLLNDGAAMRMALANEFFKDGSAPESESYNSIHIRDLERIFDLLERIRQLDPEAWAGRGLVSPFHDPKYRLIYDFPLRNAMIGRTTTWTGDTSHAITADPRPQGQTFPLAADDYVGVYRRTRDPRFAQVLFGPEGKIPAALEEPQLRAEVERIGQDRGWLVSDKSDLLDGYGHAILRSGSGDHARAFWLRYGRVVQHAHQDLLTMGLAALRRDMLPELGYPQGWTHAEHWAANWGTHYGTHITGVRTSDFDPGRLTLFADTAPARVARAVCRLSGKQEAARSRTIVLVDLSERDCYAVTLEEVLGGTQHTMSFHGPPGSVTTEGLQLEAQPGGTVLGADVPYGKYDAIPGADPELASLAFMDDVRRARPPGVWSLDYALENQEDVHLRVTTIGPEGCKLALARGKPPQGKKSYELTWSILNRSGTAPLASRFVTVLEPFEGRRVVRRVEPLVLTATSSGPSRTEASTTSVGQVSNLSGQDEILSHDTTIESALIPGPVGIRVTSDDYVDTILFQAKDTDTCTTSDGISLCGEFGFWREQNGVPLVAHLAAGTSLGRGNDRVALPQATWRGRIVRCDWKNRTVVVEPAIANPAALVGRHVRIGNPAGSSASYLIENAAATEGGCLITLSLDARVGEGFVESCEQGVLLSATRLRFHSYWHYYAGKTIANEDASISYRLSDALAGVRCQIDESTHGKVDAQQLQAEFTDRDGDGRARFAIYDYGPGDEVTCKESVSRSWSPCCAPVGSGNSRSFGLESTPERGGFHEETTTTLWYGPEGNHSQEVSGR
jgi:hypothetical protein